MGRLAPAVWEWLGQISAGHALTCLVVLWERQGSLSWKGSGAAPCRTEQGPDGRPVVGRELVVSSLHGLSAQFLAMVFQDLLTNKDDYLRASRALLREIIKQTKHEINFQAFCLGLMQERKEPQYLDMEFKVCTPPQHAGDMRAPHSTPACCLSFRV